MHPLKFQSQNILNLRLNFFETKIMCVCEDFFILVFSELHQHIRFSLHSLLILHAVGPLPSQAVTFSENSQVELYMIYMSPWDSLQVLFVQLSMLCSFLALPSLEQTIYDNIQRQSFIQLTSSLLGLDFRCKRSFVVLVVEWGFQIFIYCSIYLYQCSTCMQLHASPVLMWLPYSCSCSTESPPTYPWHDRDSSLSTCVCVKVSIHWQLVSIGCS